MDVCAKQKVQKLDVIYSFLQKKYSTSMLSLICTHFKKGLV